MLSQRHLQVAWVPGAFELPLVAKAMARSGAFDAVIAVGAVVCTFTLCLGPRPPDVHIPSES